MIELEMEINEETGREETKVWRNDELIYAGYYMPYDNFSDEIKYVITLMNAFCVNMNDLCRLMTYCHYFDKPINEEMPDRLTKMLNELDEEANKCPTGLQH